MTGEVAEWSNALDLKSSFPQGNVGSNPTLSVLSALFTPSVRVTGCRLPNYGSSKLCGNIGICKNYQEILVAKTPATTELTIEVKVIANNQ